MSKSVISLKCLKHFCRSPLPKFKVLFEFHFSLVVFCLIFNRLLKNLFLTRPYNVLLIMTFVEINNKHLMTGPEGNSEFCFPRISMFPETKSRETLRFEGNKIHCSPRDQSLSDLLYSKTKRKQIFNNALRFQQQQSTFRG